MSSFPVRVAAKAQTFTPLRALLTLLTLPLWLVGAVAGVLWLVVTWAAAAVVLGFDEALERGSAPRAATKPAPDDDGGGA